MLSRLLTKNGKILEGLGLSAESLTVVAQLQDLTPQPLHCFMEDPETGKVEIGEIYPYSTRILREAATLLQPFWLALQERSDSAKGGVTCRCWTEMIHLDARRGQISHNPELSAKTRQERLDQIEHERAAILKKHGGHAPARYATGMADAECAWCQVPKELNEAAATMDPVFVQNLLNLFGIGNLSMYSFVPFLAFVRDQLYNANLIPASQKKMVAELLDQFPIVAAINQASNALGSLLSTLKPASASTPNTNPPSTATIGSPEAGDRPTWTPDLPLPNESSSMPNIANANPNNLTA